MSLRRQLIVAFAGGLVMASAASSLSAQSASTASSAENRPSLNGLIQKYCTDCHNLEDFSGGISLEGLAPRNIETEREVGEKVVRRLRAGMMPPAGEPRPEHATLQSLAAALERRLDETASIEPGRTGIHRLNRSEYANAIRDLLAIEIDPAEFLPADDSSNGFDNQAAALTLSPALLEAYLSAADKISRMAVGLPSEPSQTLYRVAEDANQDLRIEGLPFGTRGGIKFTHHFPVDGEYNFKIFAITLGNMGNDRPFGNVPGEKLQLLVDGERVQVFDWDEEFGRGLFGSPAGDDGQALPTLDVRVPVKAGPHEIGVTFIARNYAPQLDMNNAFERSTIETGGLPGFTFYPHVGSVRVEGPFSPAGVSDTPSRNKLFSCYPDNADAEKDCARHILSELSHLAFRGLGTTEDVDELMDFYETGRENGSFDQGIAMAVQRALSDPKFIYRIEREPDGARPGDTYPLSDLDLASRLSFFLWSSIPDRELLELAEAGRLSDPAELERQVRRMLADPRSQAFTRNFAGQWLALRNLESHVPVVDRFPDFEDRLRDSFRRETELFFDALIRNDRPAAELLTADYTFVNERLAKHYGIPGIRGERFRRVELSGDLAVRRGILGKGSTLTVSSQPGRTSPVIRGYWVLSNILGVEPPPPPPDVPALADQDDDEAGNGRVPSMREQLEAHRDNPACMGCHQLMDPIGFALESYDAVGRFRTHERSGNPIDPSGVMYDGTPVDQAADVVDFLLKYEDSFVRNLTQKLMTYALGRGMEYRDMPMVRRVMEQAAAGDYRFQALITAVVQSRAFRENQATGQASEATAAVSATGG